MRAALDRGGARLQTIRKTVIKRVFIRAKGWQDVALGRNPRERRTPCGTAGGSR